MLTSPAQDKRVTHAAYMQACQQRGLLSPAARPWVQVQKRFGAHRLVLCGQVLELDAASDTGEWFKVATDQGSLWIESRNVRMCSGDGRCTCEVEARGSEGRGVPHRAPLPGARQADWRSGRGEVCRPEAITQEQQRAAPGQGAQCSA